MMCWHRNDKLNGIYDARPMEMSHAIIFQRALQCIRLPLIWNDAHLTFNNRLSNFVGEFPR
jgi:hypothetical protein